MNRENVLASLRLLLSDVPEDERVDLVSEALDEILIPTKINKDFILRVCEEAGMPVGEHVLRALTYMSRVDACREFADTLGKRLVSAAHPTATRHDETTINYVTARLFFPEDKVPLPKR